MPKKPIATETPFPQVPISRPIPRLDNDRRTALGVAASMLYDINLGNRGLLDQNLDIWNAILEMRGTYIDIPWEGASQITSPTVFSAYQEFCSRIIGSCLQPRPYTVRGNDPISSQYAHAVEQFHNTEWDKNKCFKPYEQAILLGARDGTVFMEVLYELATHQEWLDVRESDPSDPQKQVLSKKLATFVDYDAPREEPVDLKALLLYPNFATSVKSADGYGRKIYMSEPEIWAKVHAGIFDEETAEKVLQYGNTAQGERSFDPQGYSQYTISGMINVVDTAVAPPEGMRMNRGPFEIIRHVTNLFDIDEDGVPEENFIWTHYRSKLCLGAVPFDYMGGRPLFPLTMIPRPGVVYGFAVPEIGRATQEEVDTQTNARCNLLDRAVAPARYHTQNIRYTDENKNLGPNSDIAVNSKEDIGYIVTPPIPQESMIEEDKLTQKLDRALGSPQAPANAIPLGGSQQRSARAAQLDAQLRAMQSNLVNTRVRQWMLDIFEYKHGLYLRYGKNQIETVQQSSQGPQRVQIPREILGLDYTLGISGLGGALDKEGRRQDIAMLTQILLGTPLSQLFQGKLARLWNLARLNIETFDVPDVTSIIGTLDEAMQDEQQMQQAQQANAQLQALLQVLSHSSNPSPGGGGGSKPPQQPALHALPGGKM